MSEEETALMAKYGITTETHTVYYYKEHRYEKLKDALNFAEIDTNPPQKNSFAKPKNK